MSQQEHRSSFIVVHVNNALDHKTDRKLLMILFLAIYYGVNIWDYQINRQNSNAICNGNMWCNDFQLSLYKVYSISLELCMCISALFFIVTRKKYNNTGSFFTREIPLNLLTVLIIPFIIMLNVPVIIFYQINYTNSYMSQISLSMPLNHKISVPIYNIAWTLNQICFLIILALDIIGLHHNKMFRILGSFIQDRVTRITIFAIHILIMSWLFVSAFCLKPKNIGFRNLDKHDQLKVGGFALNGTIMMFVILKYSFMIRCRCNVYNHAMNPDIVSSQIRTGSPFSIKNEHIIFTQSLHRQNEQNQEMQYSEKFEYTMFGLFINIIFIVSIVFIMCGSYIDLRHGNDNPEDILAPNLLYSLQVLFLGFDLLF